MKMPRVCAARVLMDSGGFLPTMCNSMSVRFCRMSGHTSRIRNNTASVFGYQSSPPMNRNKPAVWFGLQRDPPDEQEPMRSDGRPRRRHAVDRDSIGDGRDVERAV